MRNTPNAANTPGAPDGTTESFISRAGKLMQGDSAEDLRQLERALKQLKTAQLSKMQEILEEQIKHLATQAGKLGALHEGSDQILPALLEYQKRMNREAREDREFAEVGDELKLADKASQLSGANQKIQDAKDSADGTWNHLGDLSKADIGQMVMYVMMRASQGAHDDLKAMLEEIQKIKKQRARMRTMATAGIGAGVLLLLGLLLGPAWFPPPDPESDPPEPNANLPAVQVPASDAVPIGAAPGCKISLTSPASSVDLPLSGPVNVQWSSEPPGISYTLEVLPPEGKPWLIPTDGTSKSIFMENFPAGGTYEFTVSTLDAYGAVLCRTVVSFEKPGSDDVATKKEAGDGTYCDPNGMIGC